jgi:hypothetical protein
MQRGGCETWQEDITRLKSRSVSEKSWGLMGWRCSASLRRLTITSSLKCVSGNKRARFHQKNCRRLLYGPVGTILIRSPRSRFFQLQCGRAERDVSLATGHKTKVTWLIWLTPAPGGGSKSGHDGWLDRHGSHGQIFFWMVEFCEFKRFQRNQNVNVLKGEAESLASGGVLFFEFTKG